MTEDRRSDERVPMKLAARWDGLSGITRARIDDLSLGGCFVNTRGRVDVGELISLEIQLPSKEWLLLRGEVTSYKPGVGFGVVFPFLTGEEEQAIRELVT